MKNFCYALVALSLIFLSSCSSEDSAKSNINLYENSKNDNLGVKTISNKLKSVSMPLDQYLNDSKVSDYIDTAQNVLANICMKKKGYKDYFSDEDLKISTDDNLSNFASQYYDPEFKDKKFSYLDLGILDIDFAKKYGYDTNLVSGQFYWKDEGNGKSSMQMRPEVVKAREDINKKNDAQISSDPKVVYDTKVIEKECKNTAHTKFFERLSQDVDSLNSNRSISDLIKEAKTQAKDIHEVKDSISLYKDCVNKNGYDIDTPPMTIFNENVFPEKYSKPPNSDPDNKKLAVVDVTCKNQVNLFDVWTKNLEATENLVIKDNLPLIQKQKEYIETMISYSNKIIETNGENYF